MTRTPARGRFSHPGASRRRRAVAVVGRQAAPVAFALFLVIALASPSWRVGPFTWLPLWAPAELGGRPAAIGPLALLPLIAAAAGLVGRRGPRRWGSWAVAAPLLALSALALLSLEPAATWRTLAQGIGLLHLWFVYLFVVGERPNLVRPLAIIVLIQSVVAITQFFLQRDLGLTAWGELALDPATPGISVVWDSDQTRWLRGYGLTAHPNVLASMLVIMLLWLLPVWTAARGRQRALWTGLLALGLVGVLVTFSRAAWLGGGAGLAYWWWRARPELNRHATLVLVPALILAIGYNDLIVGRFVGLETPGETRSLDQRRDDFRVAPQLLTEQLWFGVGAGNYQAAAQSVSFGAITAHNVVLLVAAEFGLVGLALWLLLAAGGLWPGRDRGWTAGGAAWLAMLVIGLFDNALWLTTSWRAAMMLALLAAGAQRPLARPSGREGETFEDVAGEIVAAEGGHQVDAGDERP